MNKFIRLLVLVSNLTIIFTLYACGGGGGGGGLPPGDTTPPKVIGTTPVSGKYTSTNITIDIQFDEDIKIPDSTNVDIIPFLANGSLNTAKPVNLKSPPFTIAQGSNELVIRPLTNGSSENALQTDTRYHVYIHGVKDNAGNQMQDCRFEFATGNFVGTIVSSTKPCDTPQPVSLNGQLEFALNSSSYSEGNSSSTTQSITVYRVGGSDGLVTVKFNLISGSGTTGATLNTDFNLSASSSSGLLTFPPGITSQAIDVDIIGDTNTENDETFSITLSEATSGATINNQGSTHIVTILNDELAANLPGTIKFTSASSIVPETVFVNQNEVGNVAVIDVIRIDGSSGILEVGYFITASTAVASSDYTPPVNGKLIFDTNILQKIKVPILKDGLYEPSPETFTVTITSINGSNIDLANNTHEVSIVSNDPKPLSRIEFSVPSSTFDENLGLTQSALVTVTRTNPIDAAASVEYYTVDNKATSGSDYVRINIATLNFSPGSKSADISLSITNDSIPEPPESFFVKLKNPSTGSILGGVQTQTHELTILDTDAPLSPGVIEFTTNAAMEVSEAAGNVIISVTRSGGTAGDLSVNYSTSPGTAISPDDFTAVTNTPITFTDGIDGSKNISIPIVNDNKVDVPANKNFTVTLSGAAVGTNKSKTVTIIDAGVTRPLTTAELVAIWSLLL
jgi:hypothetical protein